MDPSIKQRHERMMLDALRWQQSLTQNLIDVISYPVQSRESLERIIVMQGHVQQYLQHLVTEMKMHEATRGPSVGPSGLGPCPYTIRSVDIPSVSLVSSVPVTPSVPLSAPSVPLSAPSVPVTPSVPSAPSVPLSAPSVPLSAPSVPLSAPSVPVTPRGLRLSNLSPHARPFTPPPPRFSPKTLVAFIPPHALRPVVQQPLPPKLSALGRQPYVPATPTTATATVMSLLSSKEPGETLEELIQDQHQRLNQLLEDDSA